MRGECWVVGEEVWFESKGTETGMNQASLGGRDRISLTERRVL